MQPEHHLVLSERQELLAELPAGELPSELVHAFKWVVKNLCNTSTIMFFQV